MVDQGLPDIILASSSSARARLLRNAGLDPKIKPVSLDEDSIKSALVMEKAPAAHIAETLAELKTIRGARETHHYVIGADQILACDGSIFSKPTCLAEAKEQLMKLRGRSHELISAVCVAKGGSIIWRHSDSAKLYIRQFSSSFLDSYLNENKDSILTSAGGYYLESRGAQLFDWIKGDYFTILGLPLIPLLCFLREQGVMQK